MAMTDKTYEIGKYPPVNQIPLLIGRASALQSYAQLELSLAILFSVLLGTTHDLGGLVFFRITNTHARNRILDDLVTKRHGVSYNKFWKSAISLVRALDQRRNEIVHWHMINNINLDLEEKEASSLSLSPPTGWAIGSSAKLSELDLTEFIKKCDFVSRLITMFMLVVSGQMPAAEIQGIWHDIFQQQVVYPSPDSHPLSPNYKAP